MTDFQWPEDESAPEPDPAALATIRPPGRSIRTMTTEIKHAIAAFARMVARHATAYGDIDPIKLKVPEREALVVTYQLLREVQDNARMYADAIEGAFRRQMVLGDIRRLSLSRRREVQLDPPPGRYQTRADELRRPLIEIAQRQDLLTVEEINEALPTVTTVTPNHTKLNAIYRQRGNLVRDVIDRFRVRQPDDPRRMRVVFPQRRGEHRVRAHWKGEEE